MELKINNMKKGIVVVSLFNGMGTLRQAFEDMGIKVDKYYSSEIKPYAIKLQQHHFPDVIQVGNILNWREWDIDWSKVDFIGSGSPCQDLSIAGKRAGLNGSKSSLFWVFIDILNHVKSLNSNVKFLQENVGSAPLEDVRIMSEALGVFPVRINSLLVTAQNRDRYYWSNIKINEDWTGHKVTDIPQPKNRKVFLKDIIQDGFVWNIKSRAILESEERPLKQQHKMAHRYFNSGFTTLVFKNNSTYLRVKEATKIGFVDISNGNAVDLSYPKSKTRRGRSMDEKCNCLLRNNEYFVFRDNDLRYFNKTELCRLQGFQDDYCDILSRNHSASLLGDGWTLPVIIHILNYWEI